MNATEISCELVDERNLDTHYLAGRLSPEEAEALEAHFFECERCWGLVHQGLEVRSGFLESRGSAKPAVATRTRPTLSWRWWGLATAAGIAAVGLATWRSSLNVSAPPADDVLRGSATRLVISGSAIGSTLKAAWPRVSGADLYRVRLYAADGALAAEREITDTAIALVRDSVALPPQSDAFWEVQALDHLRHPIARSDLIKAVTSGPRP